MLLYVWQCVDGYQGHTYNAELGGTISRVSNSISQDLKISQENSHSKGMKVKNRIMATKNGTVLAKLALLSRGLKDPKSLTGIQNLRQPSLASHLSV